MSKRPRLKQSPILRQNVPVSSLPSGEITIPLGFLWNKEETKPLFLLGCLFHQICDIPQAAEGLKACYEHWNKTIFSKWKRMHKIGGKELLRPDERGQIDLKPVIDKVTDECGFDASDVKKELKNALGGWVKKWACGSEAMAKCIHYLWLLEAATTEQYNKQRRFYNREIKKAQQPDSAFRRYMERMVDEIAGEQAEYWKVLMSPELKRCERTARVVARKGVSEQGFNFLYEKTLMRAVWCFVQYECLGKRVEDIVIEAVERNITLPLKTLYDDRPREKYFKPFYDALALYGPITKRPSDSVRINYMAEASPEKSQNLASEVRHNLP